MVDDFDIILSPSDIVDFYGARKLAWCPPHFIQVDLRTKNLLDVEEWIYNNTTGRFSLTTKILKSDQILLSSYVVGFELQEDALFFALSFT